MAADDVLVITGGAGGMGLAERLAGPWGAKGGRTIAISPGLIDTPMGRVELDRQPSCRSWSR